MKRSHFITIFFILFGVTAGAQHKTIDSLRNALARSGMDTNRVNILMGLAKNYFISKPDSTITFAMQAYELAGKFNNPVSQAKALNDAANAYATMGDYVKGMQYYTQAGRVYEKAKNPYGIATIDNNIGATYVQEFDYPKALVYLYRSKNEFAPYMLAHKNEFKVQQLENIILENIGESYLYTKKIDSAAKYLEQGYTSARAINASDLFSSFQRDLGEVEVLKDNKTGALQYFRQAVKSALANEDVEGLSMAHLSTAALYHKYKQQDSAEFYAIKALQEARDGKYKQDVINAGKALYGYYDEDKNLPEAYKYYRLTTETRDSVYSEDKLKQLMSIDFEAKQHEQEIEAARTEAQNKIRIFILSGVIVVFLLLALIFWRNGKQRQKANRLLRKQKEEIEATLTQLKSTQAQLIQSEKMASLGELTAGIAHEIQNPLNFVNNFSEVNTELINEMKQEIASGDLEEVKSIAVDIEENSKKIAMHGKRADSIVKGMLQHSRASSNIKEPTDINKLADEYLRLAYHGLRAKDKSFNAELLTHFAEDLPEINIVPQDIGRVLLNLVNNAFYAVQKRKQSAGEDYKPTVEVTTAQKGNSIKVTVKDNGTGISDDIRDKILQPFFTTKPTGEGTGLGLSLSYDILVKGHNGKLDVKSKEGVGSEFEISIPL